MRTFRTGDFDRTRVSSVYHPFLPAHAANSLHEVSLENLWARGKRLLLVDVDNTLVQWKQEDFADPVLQWIRQAKQMGFEICIISNTRRVERLQRLSEILGVETVRGRFKPSRAMFRLALIKFKRKPHEAIMIGDQIFTDVLGANRAGIEAIWVRKMEGREFGPTSISRMGEKMLRGALYRALVTPVDESDAVDPRQVPIVERPIFRQFVKFLIVGGSSFIINYLIRMNLMFAIPYGGGLLSDRAGGWLRSAAPAVFGFAESNGDAFFPVAATIAGAVAILNSFIWNRQWTYRIRGKQERMAQLRRFYFVAIIGEAINVLLSTMLNHLIPLDPKNSVRIATVVATAVAAVWNFVAQRFYAFRIRSA
ncbi:MAG TPA: YqeG family HAD IIIA-type phosphatase [Fimbriimonas sp.]